MKDPRPFDFPSRKYGKLDIFVRAGGCLELLGRQLRTPAKPLKGHEEAFLSTIVLGGLQKTLTLNEHFSFLLIEVRCV